MARKAEPGISYYPVKVNHCQNSKIKLLFNEFNSDGYWIWKCLLDRIYEDKGYYFDTTDQDEMELFASDVCKKQISVVNGVIAGCVRRNLFDKGIFEAFGILTSDRIQMNYLEATNQRRKKGTQIFVLEKLLLVEKDQNWKNVVLLGNNLIPPGKNSIDPGHSTQSKKRVKKKESKEDTYGDKSPVVDVKFKLELKALIQQYSNLEKSKTTICDFIKNKKPLFVDPYCDVWNLFAQEFALPKITLPLTTKREKHLQVRLREQQFDFLTILSRSKKSEYLLTSNWFTFDWIIKNDSNFLKILEGNYDSKETIKVNMGALGSASVGDDIRKARISKVV